MKKIFAFSATILFLISVSFAQKRGNTNTAKPKAIVFAVLNSGQTLEPIGEINKGELVETVNGGGDEKEINAFVKNYYKPKAAYNLIFGGASNGKITIKSSNPKSDCAKNLADVMTVSTKAKMSNWVMGLAVSPNDFKAGSGVRRMPTATERAEIESLVRAEFTKQGMAANAIKKMNYYNLTALDVDNDGKAEMVGSFWADSSAKEKNLLFFVAEKGADDKYKFGYSDYAKVTPNDIMSGDLKDMNEGYGAELLIDVLDYDGDGTSEIFTIGKAFEGNNFHVYSRRDGKWTRVYESYNYHCAY